MKKHAGARRLGAAGFVAALFATLCVAIAAPASATTPQVAWSADVSDVNVHGAITGADGSVTVANCSSAPQTVGTKTFSAGGNVKGTTPVVNVRNYTEPVFTTCLSQQAAGKDGTLYGDDPTINDYYENLAAYKPDGTKLWSQTVVTTDCPSLNGKIMPSVIRIGFDGNVYVTGQSVNDWCGHPSYLTSFAPDGTLRWQVRVSTQSLPFLSAYDQGLVVGVAGVNQLVYIDYNGVVTSTVQMNEVGQPYLYGQGAGADAKGYVFAVFAHNVSQTTCSNTYFEATAVAIYGPNGFAGRYTPAPCTYSAWLKPLSTSGFVLEQELADQTWELVTFDGTGSVVKKLSLPTGDLGGFTITGGANLIGGDTRGNLVIARPYRRNDGSTIGTIFALFDPQTWNQLGVFDTYSLGDSVSVNVYPDSVVFAQSRLYFAAQNICVQQHCASSMLYAVNMAKLGLDYPRSAALGVSSAPLDTMAALGDSFSSGLGSLNSGELYEAGSGDCSRSPNAYARQLGADQSVKLELTTFVACAGNTTADITKQNGQASQVSPTAKSLFLTVGGNDVNFARLGGLCIFLDCTQYHDEFYGYLADVGTHLQASYQAALDRAPGATLYVLGYPHILPLQNCSTTGSGWFAALYAQQLVTNLHPDYVKEAKDAGLTQDEANEAANHSPAISDDEAVFSRTFENNLNLAISDAVDAVQQANPTRHIVFVSATQPGGPFDGHQLCSATPYFNGLDGANAANTFHPTAEGQGAYEQIALAALTAHQPQYVG
ncbi:MAG TPA: SGNH/GDSL hydrolase family protein [Candidatus Saccharimonas sp.]|nr:SGNH/GDSL hydrolase family protein [Candidatus Saccharimonas sp.]